MSKRPLEFLAILYLVAWSISPPLQVGMIFRIVALGCAGILALKNRFAVKKAQAAALILVAMVAVTAYIMSGASGILKQIGVYMLFLGFLMNEWYQDDWEDFKALIPITLLLLAVWNFRTASVLTTDASVARLIVRAGDVSESYLRQGVGGYGLVYAQVIICPVIFSWTLRSFRRDLFRLACGVLWGISFVMLVMSAGYTIAVFTVALGVVIYLFYRREKIAPALLLSLLLVVAAVYLICYNQPVQNFLLDVFDGTKVASKIRDIAGTVTTGETADSIQSRIVRYRADLETMLEYPLLGSWWNGGMGGHSALMGAFAQYGVLGGIVWAMMVYCVPAIWKRRPCSTTSMRTINAAVITITFTVLFDTLPYNLVMMLMIIFPILMTEIESWSAENEDIMDSESDTD